MAGSGIGALVMPDAKEWEFTDEQGERLHKSNSKIGVTSTAIRECDNQIRKVELELRKLPLYQKLLNLKAKKAELKKLRNDAEIDMHETMTHVAESNGTSLEKELIPFLDKVPAPKQKRLSNGKARR